MELPGTRPIKKIKEHETLDALVNEARAADSRVTLRPHPMTGAYYVVMKHGTKQLEKDEVYTPGTVTVVDQKELKDDPFVSSWTINGLPVDMIDGICIYVGNPGTFRVRSRSAVYRVTFHYGYFLANDSQIEVDGSEFAI